MSFSLAWAILLYALSARPAQPRPAPSFLLSLFWNGAHAPFYAVLGVLVVLSLAPRRNGRVLPTPSAIGWGIVLSGIYGAFDELHQLFVPGRHSSVLDGLTDLLGAAFGVSVLGALLGQGGARWVYAAAGCAAGATVLATVGALGVLRI